MVSGRSNGTSCPVEFHCYAFLYEDAEMTFYEPMPPALSAILGKDETAQAPIYRKKI